MTKEIEPTNPNRVPILEKAMEIVNYIGAHPEQVSQSELQKALGISQASCYRIIATLVDKNWLVKVGKNHYDISTGLLAVTAKMGFRLDRFRKLQPLLNHLADEVKFSVKVSVRDKDEFVNVCSARYSQNIGLFSEPGYRCPVSQTASVGTIFMAEEPIEHQRKMMRSNEEFRLLQEHIIAYRADGFSFHPGSVAPDAIYRFDTLSFPIRRDSSLIGVLSLLALPGNLSGIDRKTLFPACLRTIEQCLEWMP